MQWILLKNPQKIQAFMVTFEHLFNEFPFGLQTPTAGGLLWCFWWINMLSHSYICYIWFVEYSLALYICYHLKIRFSFALISKPDGAHSRSTEHKFFTSPELRPHLYIFLCHFSNRVKIWRSHLNLLFIISIHVDIDLQVPNTCVHITPMHLIFSNAVLHRVYSVSHQSVPSFLLLRKIECRIDTQPTPQPQFHSVACVPTRQYYQN